jgi:NADH dehydrogenase [ubiquinone] 1 alpha subcomplex assembly factor 6
VPLDAVKAARAIGTAWALTGILRAVPFHARQHRLLLPADRLAAAGVRVGRLFDLKPDPGLAKVSRDLGERALASIALAEQSLSAIPRVRRWPLLLGVLAQLYLRDLRENRWDPFASGLVRGRPLAVLHLAARRLSRRY